MNVLPPPVISVDGPSGVGKGLVTRWLAGRLGYHRLDSGALYRILALAAHRRDVDLHDSAALARLAPALGIRFAGSTEDDEAILVDGEDWTHDIRKESTGALASLIAVQPAVRDALLQRQRDFREAPGLIADGRDMGTIVFPDACVKIFMDASPDERAQRRLKQLSAKGIEAKIAPLREEIRARDERDRNRPIAPLRPADGAEVVDTTGLSPADVLAKVELLVQRSGLV
ncbi:MAG: (d)CMP kinase [Solimonas sp.]